MIDANNLKDVCAVLHAYGVSYFKSSEMELRLHNGIKSVTQESPINSLPSEIKGTDLPEDIKHKVDEFTSVMKLGDVDLVDRLFPEHTQDEE